MKILEPCKYIIVFAFIMFFSFSSCAQDVTQYKLKVVKEFPHDRGGYTQGLFFHNGDLYESCGQYGASNFRKVDLLSGKILRKFDFDKQYFVEGSCVVDGRLYVLTWMEGKCFVYDINSMAYLGELRNPREGWGLTTNGKDLIMSDGSDKLYFLDPMSFNVRATKKVTLNGRPLYQINELEMINGDIWANVYTEDFIVIIDANTGKVKGKVDCKGLLPKSLRRSNTDVLNGIAFNSADNGIYLTGKYWPKMYKIELVKK